MEKKVTKKDRFNELLRVEGVAENAELVAFIKHEIELLDKKADGKKPTKEQEANKVLMDKIVSVMTSEGATASDIAKKSDDLKDLSNQKVSSMLRKLVEDGRVVKYSEGKKSLFRLA